LASTFVEIRDAALVTAAIATPIALVMWSSWDINDRWSRSKHFVISGALAVGIAVAIVGAWFGLRLWLGFSLGALSWAERSLPSWLIPTVVIAFGLIAALWTLRSVLARTISGWRWVAVIFVPFWAIQWIAWLGGVLLGVLLLIPLIPLLMWGEKDRAEVAKKQYRAYRERQERLERERSQRRAALRQQIADKRAAEEKWQADAPLRAEQRRLRNLERRRARRMAEKEARRIREADEAMKDQLYAEIYRTEGFRSRPSRTREVRLRVVSSETQVSPPSITLPPGDYVGYVETRDFEGEQHMALAMLFLDEATIGRLGLSEQRRPIKFEVLRHLKSNAIQLIEE
jgi:hypothetical protein